MSEMALAVRALRGMSFSLFVFTVVVWGWGFLALNCIQGLGLVLTTLIPLAIALPLLILSIRFSRRLRGLQGPSPFSDKRLFWFYMAIVALTFIGYGLANTITRALHHPEYVVPAATLIIALHFLALIPVFKDKRYYITTLVFSLVALLTVLLVPKSFHLGSLSTIPGGGGWMVVTGCACLLWLWCLAVYVFLNGTQKIQQLHTTLPQTTISSLANS